MKNAKNPHVGSLFEDWLKEEGMHAEVSAAAVKRTNTWLLDPSSDQSAASVESGKGKTRESCAPIDRPLD